MPMQVVDLEADSYSEGHTEVTPLILPSVKSFDTRRPFREATKTQHGRHGREANPSETEAGLGPSITAQPTSITQLADLGASITGQPASITQLLNDGGPLALDRVQADSFTMSYLTRHVRPKVPIRWYQCICEADPPKMCESCCVNRQDILMPERDPLLEETYRHLFENRHHRTILRR